MTVLPSLTMPVMMFHKNRRAFGSIPVVGSSCGSNENTAVIDEDDNVDDDNRDETDGDG